MLFEKQDVGINADFLLKKILDLPPLYLFILLRIVPILVTALYIHISPDHLIPGKLSIYIVLSLFFILSWIFWFLRSMSGLVLSRLLNIVIVADIIFITVLVRLTGGLHSEFYLAYYLPITVEAIYFGLELGLLTGAASSMIYLVGNADGISDLSWTSILLRIFFMMAIAGTVGLFSKLLKERNDELTRLNIDLDKKVDELSTLYNIGKSISSFIELDSLLKAILDMVSVALRLNSVAILLNDERTNILKVTMSKGFPEDVKDVSFHPPADRDEIGWVVSEARPLLIYDARKDGRFSYFKGRKTDISSFVAVPLISKGWVLGVLCATDPLNNAYTEDDLRMLSAVAGQISVAIENARLFEETKKLAITDGLTELSTPRSFHQFLQAEVERINRYGGILSLIMSDIDDFKSHNDQFGHPSGDEVLKIVAKILRKDCRSTDMVARYGGEEFAIVFINVGKEEALRLAERIRDDMAAQDFPGNKEILAVRKTISLGVAEYPSDAMDKAHLIQCADDALYMAKRSGKNKTCVFGNN